MWQSFKGRPRRALQRDTAIGQDTLSKPMFGLHLCPGFFPLHLFLKLGESLFFYKSGSLIEYIWSGKFFHFLSLTKGKLLLCFECCIKRIPLISATIPSTDGDPHTHHDRRIDLHPQSHHSFSYLILYSFKNFIFTLCFLISHLYSPQRKVYIRLCGLGRDNQSGILSW